MSLQRLTFHVTDRCQLNCDHCLRDPQTKAKDLELPLIESVIDQAEALFDVKHVGLTGGEPALHPQFYAIIDAIVDRDCTWHVVSNGERFERIVQRLTERPARLAGLRLLNFSLDGATPETHDSVREQGSFRSVMQAVSICRARSIPFLIQITLNARNVEEIEEMALLASQLGAEKFAFNFTQPTGTFLDVSLHLPASEWKRAMDRINRVREVFNIFVLHSEIGPHEEPFHMCEMWRQEHLHVDPLGRLNLCCQHAGVPSVGPLSDIAGDLHEMTLAQAHRNFTRIVHETIEARLALIAEQNLSEWDRHFSCNWSGAFRQAALDRAGRGRPCGRAAALARALDARLQRKPHAVRGAAAAGFAGVGLRRVRQRVREWRLALETFGLRAAVPVLLWALPLDRALHVLTPRAARALPSPERFAAIESITDLVTRGLRLTRTACLKRAVIRYVLLRRQGFAARFVIGVRKGGSDGFEAHAWVTVDEQPVMERGLLDYHSACVWPPAG